jgi:O-antigen/teichoic acid export membrane protein
MPSFDTLVASSTAGSGPTTTSRMRGVVLMLLGPLVTLGGGAGLWAALADPDTRLDTNDETAVVVLAVMALVLVLGPLFTLGGWQLWRQGRFSRALAIAAAAAVLALLALMPLARRLLG